MQCKQYGFVYVSPIETDKSLILDGPVLGNRSRHLLESDDPHDIEGSWEQPLIEAHVREAPAKRVNCEDALVRINKLAGSRGRLLDVGCFCGLFLDVAARNGWECYGLEPLVMPAIYARGQFGLTVTTDTLRDDSFEPSLFDVVTALQVFEHLLDPVGEINKIKRFLKPKGLLLIEVPNINTAAVRLLKHRHRHFVEDHLNFFSAATLSLLLQRHGFAVREVFYPSRVLSLRQIAYWIGKTVSSRMAAGMTSLIERMHVDHMTLRLNFRDIVTVIAEKEAGC